MENTTKTKSKKRLDMIAIFVSIISLAFTITYTIWKEMQNGNEKREDLYISIQPVDGDFYTYMIQSDSNAVIIPVDYECIVVNNGITPITLIGYHIYEIDGDGKQVSYSSLDLGLYRNDNSLVQIPITLQSGDSSSFKIKIGVKVSPSVASLLVNKYDKKTEISFIELLKYLADNGTDIYGNEAKPIKAGNNVIGLSIEDLSKMLEYKFVVGSSRNVKYSVIFDDLSRFNTSYLF